MWKRGTEKEGKVNNYSFLVCAVGGKYVEKDTARIKRSAMLGKRVEHVESADAKYDKKSSVVNKSKYLVYIR